MGLVLLLAVVAIAGALIYIATTSHNVTSRDVAWLSASPTATSSETDVYATYLRRHRHHRLVGGVVGTTFAFVVGIRYYSSVSIGFGNSNPLSDLFFCSLAGIIIGTLLAERFRLREPASPHIAASLTEREISAGRSLVNLARLLTAASIIAGLVLALFGSGFTGLSISIGGVALAAIAEVTRAAIIGRRRPVLSPAATEVDLRLRSFALQAVSKLQLAAAILIVAWVHSKVPTVSDQTVEAQRVTWQIVGVARFIFGLSCLGVVVYLLHRAAPRPPLRWIGPDLT